MLHNIDELVKVEEFKIKANKKNLELDQLKKSFKEKEFEDFAKLNTKGLSLEELKDKLERIVVWNLNKTDNRTDYLSIKQVSERIAEKILNYRNTYNQEAIGYNKKMYFFESRFELTRESKLREYLSEYYKLNNEKSKIQTTGVKIKFDRNLKRLSQLDSCIAKRKLEVYFEAADKTELMQKFHNGNIKIRDLTQEYIAKSHSNISANYIAESKVAYEEKHGRHMPVKLESYLNKVSEYVDNNYNDLKRLGFSDKEALVSFNEGDKLLAKYDRNKLDMSVDKSEIKSIQKDSRQQIEVVQEHNIGIGNQGFSM